MRFIPIPFLLYPEQSQIQIKELYSQIINFKYFLELMNNKKLYYKNQIEGILIQNKIQQKVSKILKDSKKFEKCVQKYKKCTDQYLKKLFFQKFTLEQLRFLYMTKTKTLNQKFKNIKQAFHSMSQFSTTFRLNVFQQHSLYKIAQFQISNFENFFMQIQRNYLSKRCIKQFCQNLKNLTYLINFQRIKFESIYLNRITELEDIKQKKQKTISIRNYIEAEQKKLKAQQFKHQTEKIQVFQTFYILNRKIKITYNQKPKYQSRLSVIPNNEELRNLHPCCIIHQNKVNYKKIFQNNQSIINQPGFVFIKEIFLQQKIEFLTLAFITVDNSFQSIVNGLQNLFLNLREMVKRSNNKDFICLDRIIIPLSLFTFQTQKYQEIYDLLFYLIISRENDFITEVILTTDIFQRYKEIQQVFGYLVKQHLK